MHVAWKRLKNRILYTLLVSEPAHNISPNVFGDKNIDVPDQVSLC